MLQIYLNRVMATLAQAFNGKLLEIIGSFILGAVGGAFLLYVQVERMEVRVQQRDAQYQAQMNLLQTTMQFELDSIKSFITEVRDKAMLPKAAIAISDLNRSDQEQERILERLEKLLLQNALVIRQVEKDLSTINYRIAMLESLKPKNETMGGMNGMSGQQ